MDNNNNADFESAVGDTHAALKPAPDMTRPEFLARLETLSENLRDDHAGLTGVSDTELHSWDYWVGELTAAYVNS